MADRIAVSADRRVIAFVCKPAKPGRDADAKSNPSDLSPVTVQKTRPNDFPMIPSNIVAFILCVFFAIVQENLDFVFLIC